VGCREVAEAFDQRGKAGGRIRRSLQPFKAEQDNSWKTDNKNYEAKTDKTFHKNWGCGNSHQKYHNKGNTEVKTAVPVTRNWAPEVLCIRCGRGGHTASLCRSRWPNLHQNTQVQNTAPDTEPKVICLVTQHPNSKLDLESHRVVHEKLAPFCANAILCTNNGARRPVVLLRDSGALQSLVSKECLNAGDYVDRLLHRLIQKILGQLTEIPLVEVSVESDKLSGKILCGLIENLPHGVDFLIGNDLQEEMPLHVSLVTRARTYNTDRNAVVSPQTEANDSQTHVHYNSMPNVDAGHVHDIIPNDSVPNYSDPVIVLTNDSDDDVLNDDMMNQEQAELHSNVSDIADTTLKAEYDNLGNLFEEIEKPLLSDGDMASRAKLIELQGSDRSLDKLFFLAQMGQTNNAVSYFAIRNDVLVRHSRNRVMPVGLEVTEIVVPRQLQECLSLSLVSR